MPKRKKKEIPENSNTPARSIASQSIKTKIAIIGGGIAGLYCGHRLLQESEQDFLIAEASNHIGGRIWTTRILENGKFAGDSDKPIRNKNGDFTIGSDKIEFCAEFGPMRIELELQKYLHCLLVDLGLDKDQSEFPPYESPTSDRDPKYELKGEEQDQETPLDLLELAIIRILGKFRSKNLKLQGKLDDLVADLSRATATRQGGWKTSFLQWVETLDEPDYQNIRQDAIFDNGTGDWQKEGTELWNMGFWNLLSEVLSHHAVMKLRDLGTFYHLIPENPNAAEWLIFWLRGLRTSNKLVGIRGGMQRITEKLQESIESDEKERIRRNTRLTKLAEEDNKIKLTFERTNDEGERTGEEMSSSPSHAAPFNNSHAATRKVCTNSFLTISLLCSGSLS